MWVTYRASHVNFAWVMVSKSNRSLQLTRSGLWFTRKLLRGRERRIGGGGISLKAFFQLFSNGFGVFRTFNIFNSFWTRVLVDLMYKLNQISLKGKGHSNRFNWFLWLLFLILVIVFGTSYERYLVWGLTACGDNYSLIAKQVNQQKE